MKLYLPETYRCRCIKYFFKQLTNYLHWLETVKTWHTKISLSHVLLLTFPDRNTDKTDRNRKSYHDYLWCDKSLFLIWLYVTPIFKNEFVLIFTIWFLILHSRLAWIKTSIYNCLLKIPFSIIMMMIEAYLMVFLS